MAWVAPSRNYLPIIRDAGVAQKSAPTFGRRRNCPRQRTWHDVACQQLLLAKQSRILQRLEVGQVAQRIEAEMRKECPRRHIGVGRTWLWAARTKGTAVMLLEENAHPAL